jgi:hypothetical protein
LNNIKNIYFLLLLSADSFHFVLKLCDIVLNSDNIIKKYEYNIKCK